MTKFSPGVNSELCNIHKPDRRVQSMPRLYQTEETWPPVRLVLTNSMVFFFLLAGNIVMVMGKEFGGSGGRQRKTKKVQKRSETERKPRQSEQNTVWQTGQAGLMKNGTQTKKAQTTMMP